MRVHVTRAWRRSMAAGLARRSTMPARRRAGIVSSLALLAVSAVACAGGEARAPGHDTAPARGADTASRRADVAPARPALATTERAALPGIVAFIVERGAHRTAWLATPDGTCARPLSADSTDRADAYPVGFAPDGRALLLVRAGQAPGRPARRDGTDVEWLERWPLDGGAPGRIGRPSTRVRNAAWSPDGRWVVYESDHEAFREVYRTPVDGGAPRRLTDAREGNFEPSVSPDGRQVAFSSSRDGNQQLYVMDADGARQRRLVAFHRDDWGARWSPDGRAIAFTSQRAGHDRVHVVQADGTELRRVSRDNAGGGRAWLEESPAWSPDARLIAYVRRDSGGADPRVVIVDARTGAERAVVSASGGVTEPAWAPDGRHLVVVRGRAEAATAIVTRLGEAEAPLAPVDGAAWMPRWSAAPATTLAWLRAGCIAARPGVSG